MHQVYSYQNLDGEAKAFKVDPQNEGMQKDLTEADFKKLTHTVAEEQSRRNIKRDVKPLERAQILSLLLPGYEKIALEYKAAMKVQIEKKLAGGNTEDPYAMFKDLADKLRKKANKGKDMGNYENGEEDKADETGVKEANMQDEELVTLDKVVSEHLEKLSWVENLANKSTYEAKMVKRDAQSLTST